jgi:hypothetical protein
MERGEITHTEPTAEAGRRAQQHTIAKRFEKHEKKYRPDWIKVVRDTRRVYGTTRDGDMELSMVTFEGAKYLPDILTFPEKLTRSDLSEMREKLPGVADAERKEAEG